MNNEFGLSPSQLNSRYYGLRPKLKETSASFILRVEQERRTLGANEEATMHCFVPKLEHAMQVLLQNLRDTKADLQGVNLTWQDVVSHARNKLT